MENSTEVPYKLKIELPYDPGSPGAPLLDIYSEKNIVSKDTYQDICTPMFIAVLFTIANMHKQPK